MLSLFDGRPDYDQPVEQLLETSQFVSITLMPNSDRSINDGDRGGWYRSPAVLVLLVAALALSLLLAGLVVAGGRLNSSAADALDHPAHPATDDQSKAEVLEPAKQIVTIAELQKPTAGYLLMSCKNHDDPPYQGAIYLNFSVPTPGPADHYFAMITTALIAHGWKEGSAPSRTVHGSTLYKDDVTAIIDRDSDYPNLGVVRLYGQCRNINDHRNDATAWTDITDQISRQP